MSLHPNIDPQELTPDGRLLTRSELMLISKVESFIHKLTNDIQTLRQNKRQLNHISEQRMIASDPFQHIDNFLIQKPENPEDVTATYQKRILLALHDLIVLAKSAHSKDFLKELIINIERIDAKDASYGTYADCLNEVWSKHMDDAQDMVLIQELDEQERVLNDEMIALERQLNDKIQHFKTQQHLDFDLRDEYQLIKLSKRSQNLNFSVLYIKSDDHAPPQPFALYRGKMGKMLGEGGFGKVKLCQNIHTGEWAAVKIQQSMQESAKEENQVLRDLDRFIGEALRAKKYYGVQNLIYGKDLHQHLNSLHGDSLANRLLIAEKAANLVSQFHETYLHRDLKPENFIWDEDTKELYLCDFGMAIPLEGNREGILGPSGSGTFLAPEIDDKVHRGPVTYTKKTDIYALGKVFEEIFKDFPSTPGAIIELISQMTKPNADDRLGNAKDIFNTLKANREELHSIQHSSRVGN